MKDSGVFVTVNVCLRVQLLQPWSEQVRVGDAKDAAVRSAKEAVRLQVQHQVCPEAIEAAYERYLKAREAPVSEGGLSDLAAFRAAVLGMLPQASGARLALVSATRGRDQGAGGVMRAPLLPAVGGEGQHLVRTADGALQGRTGRRRGPDAAQPTDPRQQVVGVAALARPPVLRLRAALLKVFNIPLQRLQRLPSGQLGHGTPSRLWTHAAPMGSATAPRRTARGSVFDQISPSCPPSHIEAAQELGGHLDAVGVLALNGASPNNLARLPGLRVHHRPVDFCFVGSYKFGANGRLAGGAHLACADALWLAGLCCFGRPQRLGATSRGVSRNPLIGPATIARGTRPEHARGHKKDPQPESRKFQQLPKLAHARTVARAAAWGNPIDKGCSYGFGVGALTPTTPKHSHSGGAFRAAASRARTRSEAVGAALSSMPTTVDWETPAASASSRVERPAFSRASRRRAPTDVRSGSSTGVNLRRRGRGTADRDTASAPVLHWISISFAFNRCSTVHRLI